jgi:hypothetical protein
MARKPFKCDACMRMVPKGDRLCSLGQFRTCRDCEHTLPARFELWLDRHSDWSRKLDMNQAVEVRTLYDAGQHTYAQLAEMFGVNATTIGDIARGRRYQDAI